MSSLFNNKDNVIINGDMRVAQRGTSTAIAVANIGVYPLDGYYYAQNSEVRLTITQDTDVPTNTNFQYSLKTNITTADASFASGQYSYLVQRNIEGYIFKSLVGKACMFSFWIKSGTTGIMSICFSNWVDRTYVAEITVNVANTWEFKTVPIVFSYSGGTWNYTNGYGIYIMFIFGINAEQNTSLLNTWNSDTLYASPNQVNFCADTAKDIWITGVQLTLGSDLKPFKHRMYHEELALCQRYYYRITAPHFEGIGSGSTAITKVGQIHPIPMRAAPAVTYSGTIDLGDGVTAGPPTLASISADHSSINYVEFDGVASASLTANQIVTIYSTGAGYFEVSAE